MNLVRRLIIYVDKIKIILCFGIGYFKFKSSYLFPGHWSFSSMLRYPCGKRTSTWLHLLHLSYFACHSLWLNVYVKVCFPFSLCVPRDYIPNDIYANIFFPFILLFSFLFFPFFSSFYQSLEKLGWERERFSSFQYKVLYKTYVLLAQNENEITRGIDFLSGTVSVSFQSCVQVRVYQQWNNN